MAKSPKPQSRAEAMAARLQQARHRFLSLPSPGARPLPVIKGVTQKGAVVGNFDSKLAEMTTVLKDSGKFYTFSDQVVEEYGEGEQAELSVLAVGKSVESVAFSILPNYLICQDGYEGDNKPVMQYPLPSKLASVLLNRYATRKALPAIKSYFKRPVLDENFILRGPGWHDDIGVLVHGIAVEPESLGDAPSPTLPILERLPPHLRQLLSDFVAKSDADRAGMVAAIVTGVLASHFVECGKPIFLLDGNQPGIGKTLFATIIGILLDGEIPEVNSYTPNEEELEKQIGATIRTANQSLIIFDNAKVRAGDVINSPKLESSCVAPWISGRILSTSSNYKRRNDLLWFVTMNDTKVSRDLKHRGVPIQFHFEGEPGERDYGMRSALDYAIQHRREILAEVYGMVYRWTAAGRIDGTRLHRLTKWAVTVGGIMVANGFPEFLANLNEATAEFDSGADELASIAEVCIRNTDAGPLVEVDADGNCPKELVEARALPASKWVLLLMLAGVDKEKLEAARSERAKNTITGNNLVKHLGRSITVEHGGREARMTLRRLDGRANSKRYYFEISWGAAAPDALPETESEPPIQIRRKRPNDRWHQREIDFSGPSEGGGPTKTGSTTKVHRR